MNYRLKVKILFLSLFLLIAMTAFCRPAFEAPASSESSASQQENIDILFVTTYTPEYRWSARIISSLEQFTSESEGKTWSTLYIPIVSAKSIEDINNLEQMLFDTIEQKQPKSIVMIGSSSMAFCEDIETRFNDIPIMVISGQDYAFSKEALSDPGKMTNENMITVEDIENNHNVTVECMPVYLDKEIELISDIMPDLDTLYYIGGDDLFSLSKREELGQYLQAQSSKITIVDINAADKTFDDLVRIAKDSDPKSCAMLFSSWLSNKNYENGAVLMNNTVLALSSFSIPIFIIRDNGWMDESSDILGGCFVDDGTFDKEIDQAVHELLGGKEANQIKSNKDISPIFKVNYSKMEDFGFDPSNCPEGTVFTNKPDSFFKSNYKLLIAIGLLILLLIVGLLINFLRARNDAKENLENNYKIIKRRDEILNSMPLIFSYGTLIKDKDGTVIDYKPELGNDKAEEAIAIRNQKTGIATFCSLFPDDAEEFIPVLDNAIKKAKEGEMVEFAHLLNGKMYQFRVRSYSEDKADVQLIDITEQWEAHKKLVKANETMALHMQFIDQLPSSYSIIKLIRDDSGNVIDGRPEYGNKKVMSLYQKTNIKLGDKTLKELWPDSMNSFLSQLKKMQDEGQKVFGFEVHNSIQDSYAEFLIQILDSDRIGVMIKDLTAERRANKKIRQANEEMSRLQYFIDHIQVQYCVIEPIKDDSGNVIDGTVLQINKRAKEIGDSFGVNLIGKTMSTYMPKEVIQTITSGINKHTKTGERRFDIDVNIPEKEMYMESIIVIHRDGKIGILTTDMSKVKKAEEVLEKANESLKEAKEKAEAADRAKTAFIHNMSHEIRTPLNAIVGFSQLLSLPEGFCSDEERTEYREYVTNNSEMLTLLIDDLLNLSDAESGKYTVNIAPCKCNEVCRHAMKTVEHRVPSGVELQFESDCDDEYTIESDARRIQQVLINFLTNACKHTTEGHIKLSISQTENPGKITFSVEDTGEGIDPKYADAIFERFMMINHKADGKGLGLHICKAVAKMMDGEVKLDTSYTGGARFVFIINNK